MKAHGENAGSAGTSCSLKWLALPVLLEKACGHKAEGGPGPPYLPSFPTAITGSPIHHILNGTLQIYLSGQRIQIKNETTISLA